MLWHSRCRWPARLSLPPTPRHGPRKNATRMFPVVQGESVFSGMSQARRRTRLGWVTFTGAVAQMRHPYRRSQLPRLAETITHANGDAEDPQPAHSLRRHLDHVRVSNGRFVPEAAGREYLLEKLSTGNHSPMAVPRNI